MDKACGCKKAVLAVFAVYAFKLLSGLVLCGWLFKWVYQLPPVDVWRVMDAPARRYYFGTLLVSFFFVLVYKLYGKALAYTSRIRKGLVYGVSVWAVGIVPGMIATLVFMTVNMTVIVYWTVMGLILTVIEGVIVASLVGDETETCCLKK